MLGVVAIETFHYGPSQTLFSLEGAARAAGHAVTFASMPADGASLQSTVDQLAHAPVDGIAIMSPVRAVMDAIKTLHNTLPVVVVGGDRHSGPATVAIDQTIGAGMATRHLLELGHETVHHVSGPPAYLEARARRRGWTTMLRTMGAPHGRSVIGDWSARGGYAAGTELAQDPDVTAIFAANDQTALGVLKALAEQGREVPEDISVVGFDDAPEAAYYRPSLTTVRQDFGEVGRRAVELLIDRIEGRAARTHLEIVPELVIRCSTSRLGTQNRG